MRGRTLLFALLLATAFDTRLEASCIDPARLAHSAVSITRLFDDAERSTKAGVIGISATAWFLSSTTIVTVEHVSTAMMLTARDWKTLDIRDGNDSRSIPARVTRVMGLGAERLAVIELHSELPGARTAAIHTGPLMPDAEVVTLAYAGDRPRVVGGRFVKYVDDERFGDAALLELFDGNDRLAVDHGASGAPVYDCDGRVVAVVSTVITQTLGGFLGGVRVSTAWGTPNVLSVPIKALEHSLQAR